MLDRGGQLVEGLVQPVHPVRQQPEQVQGIRMPWRNGERLTIGLLGFRQSTGLVMRFSLVQPGGHALCASQRFPPPSFCSIHGKSE